VDEEDVIKIQEKDKSVLRDYGFNLLSEGKIAVVLTT